MLGSSTTLLLAAALGANAQTLYEAISRIPVLSNFTAFYRNNEAFANLYFKNESNYPITFLAPDDKAFASYQAQFNTPFTDVPPQQLLDLLQYHTLVSDVTKSKLDEGSAAGLSVPTLLTNGKFNNRSVGVSMAAKFGGDERASGQVVFIKGENAGPSSKFRLMTRQDSVLQSSVRSGMSSDVNLTVLGDKEGVWSGGRFHIVDGLLTPPTLCKDTIRDAGLSNLDNALNRTKLWDTLDSSKNVTCLGPNDKAFGDAGRPDAKLNETALTGAIMFHTLPEVTYSDYLKDGQEFKSLQNGTVRVKIEGSGKNRTIWFNNARVVDANVLTHNGLVHVLDAVMVPLEDMNSRASATPSSTPSATETRTGTGTSAATSSAAGKSVIASVGTRAWTWIMYMLVGALVGIIE
ncbi:FAS1 domain-containing protein [Periconia macrospinosa]|uniref:FAS1 domain-containing protein n=1 Tax=Periconia macrospinosa TaxID=97972 RepID=A0A2V1E047_9PLEO|nr:FAS1 domain-containing protein [Periconia macrospinosa]